MRNPSYLIRSRHNIYYFRWPVPPYLQESGRSRHIKVSLRTREPKEALRLASILEYHAYLIMQMKGIEFMEFGDIRNMLQEYFYELVDQKKAEIHKSGPLSQQDVNALMKELSIANKAIEHDQDMDAMAERVQPIFSRFDVSIDVASPEYQMLKDQYKHAYRGYCEKVLSHNQKQTEFLFTTRKDYLDLIQKNNAFPKPEYRLSILIPKFLEHEARNGNLDNKAKEEREVHMAYLMELLGEGFNLVNFDGETSQKVLDALLRTPTNRNKKKDLKGLSLSEQLETEGFDVLSNGTVNKYLGAYRQFLSWLIKNNYKLEKNYFESMNLEDKKRGKRDQFKREEIAEILKSLEPLKHSKNPKDQRNYWGTLLAVYTGSRLNEFCSLMPKDLLQDENTGIWYVCIEDEIEAQKKVKTEASHRYVPIHSKLIDHGFIKFVEERKALAEQDASIRLFPALSYKPNTGWGRKFGDWFNNILLVKLGLKVKLRKTLHSLRHSFITNLSIAGVDSSYIKSLAGHEDGTVTSSVYTHFGPDHIKILKDTIEKLKY
ncbi:MAG: hypothetical protein CMH32_01085 [Micavibrio sp.]|nr:hypothetical protein [Micavibrio sp.]